VFNFVKLAELYYAGSHGMDIKGPTPESKHAKAKVREPHYCTSSQSPPCHTKATAFGTKREKKQKFSFCY